METVDRTGVLLCTLSIRSRLLQEAFVMADRKQSSEVRHVIKFLMPDWDKTKSWEGDGTMAVAGRVMPCRKAVKRGQPLWHRSFCFTSPL